MSFDIQKLVRSHIADLQPYSSARDEFGPVEGEVFIFMQIKIYLNFHIDRPLVLKKYL